MAKECELSRYRALRYSNIAYWIYYVKDKDINQQPLRALPLFQRRIALSSAKCGSKK